MKTDQFMLRAEGNRYYYLRRDLFLLCKDLLPKTPTYETLISELEANGFTSKVRKFLAPPLEADLHLHSYHSDGQLSPKHLVWLGKIIGLNGMALVDHDNISGLELFVNEGNNLGIQTWAGLELKTDIPGCEILLYIPQAERFLTYLHRPISERFRKVLIERQKCAHEQTLFAKKQLNLLLKDLGKSDFITDEEIGSWYSGIFPFYPGTLCVLFLKRLSVEEEGKLGVSTPRDINIRYLSPILREWRKKTDNSVESTFSLLNEVKNAGLQTFAVLAHPIELVRNAKLSIKEVEEFTLELAQKYNLDGMEVNNSRDTLDDTVGWLKMMEKINLKLTDTGRKLHAFSMSSDFHILSPGEKGGNFTIGFGLLDEDHPNGNLHPVDTWAQLKNKLGIW